MVDKDDAFIVVDPPRKGVDRGTLNAILKSGIKNMVMISCDPATMARDVGILTGALQEKDGELKKCNIEELPKDSEYFKIKSVQPFDMFPQTRHVETLVCLSKKTEKHI